MSRTYVQLAHPPTDREQLWWAVRAFFGVSLPRQRVCPDHCAPFDAFADAYFRQCTVRDGKPVEPKPMGRAIWHGARGLAGKSLSLSTLGLTFACLDGAEVTVLGGSMAQSANVHNYMAKLTRGHGLPPDMVLDITATRITLANKSKLVPIPASHRTVRSPHTPKLLIDEADEMDLDIYEAAQGIPLPQNNDMGIRVPTMTVVSSTWQHATGTFTEVLKRAEQNGDPIYRWCHMETANPVDGWLTPDVIDEKRRSVSDEMWRVEFLLGEPSIANRAFNSDAVDAAFDNPFEPVSKREEKDFEEYVLEKPVKHGAYVASADWAKEDDKTVLLVVRVDEAKRRPVYFARLNRRPYPVMIGMFNEAIRRYRVGTNGVWHDSTGLGNVVNDYVDGVARPFHMAGDKRARLLSEYVNAIEKGTWAWPRIHSAHLEMKWAKVGDLYSNGSGFHLPDTVCAGALAEHAARYVSPFSFAPVTVKRGDELPKNVAQFSERPESDHADESPEPASRGFSLLV